MKTFLEESMRADGFECFRTDYFESDNKHSESHIWKVGVLLLVDANKADWITVGLAYQPHEKAKPIFAGSLHFPGGENDDAGRTLQRMLDLLCMYAGWHFARDDAREAVVKELAAYRSIPGVVGLMGYVHDLKQAKDEAQARVERVQRALDSIKEVNAN